MINFVKAFVLVMALSSAAHAAVVPDFADNLYQNHELSRSEQKCLDEGYKITYANCSGQTAPTDRCPYHDSYYRNCSRQQWCLNNNYSFSYTDCKVPLYATKLCPNKFPLYRACVENTAKACMNAGFSSDEQCQLTDKRCPYSVKFGVCCDNCSTYSTLLNQIPVGFVADGETCKTCAGLVKTNIRPADCEGFENCRFGPASPQTPSCRSGYETFYSACKTADALCREEGFSDAYCSETEETLTCPHNPKLKKCRVNCLKLARKLYPQADIISEDVKNPVLDLTKKELRSLVGMDHPECKLSQRPVIDLNITEKTFAQYQDLFDRKIENVIIRLNFGDAKTFKANGSMHNVKIIFSGLFADCPLESRSTEISGLVSLADLPMMCSNLKIAPESKFLTTGSIRGNVTLGKDSALGVKGDLFGALQTGAYTQLFIKGRLEYNDKLNKSLYSESISFGCNSKNKIVEGIFADTANVFVKQYAKLDTPSISLKSVSNSTKLPNSLSGLHLYKFSNIFYTYGDDKTTTIFPIVENPDSTCDDKYYIHLGSAADKSAQINVVEPANRLEDKWKCRSVDRKLQSCD